jgi:hypothetical protein
MKIVNIIDKASGSRITIRDNIEGIMLHRAGIDLHAGIILGVSGPELVDIFTGHNPRFPSVTEATGRRNPYTLYIGGHREADGIVWQAIHLNEVGPHARCWSHSYIGIACIGDFRHEEPSPAQRNALIDLLAGICAAFAFDPYRAIRGHGEVQGGEKAPSAPGACPGSMMDLNAIRYDTEQVMKERACRALLERGIVF